MSVDGRLQRRGGRSANRRIRACPLTLDGQALKAIVEVPGEAGESDYNPKPVTTEATRALLRGVVYR